MEDSLKLICRMWAAKKSGASDEEIEEMGKVLPDVITVKWTHTGKRNARNN